MPLTISWLRPDRVILIKNEGSVTRADILRGAAVVNDMLERSTAAKVDIVIDVSRLENTPDLRTLMDQTWARHIKANRICIAGPALPELKLVLSVFSKAERLQLTFVESTDAALRSLGYTTSSGDEDT